MSWLEGFSESRLLVAPDPNPSTIGCCTGCVLYLRHPKSGNPTSFLFINGGLQELNWYKASYGSWFLGDYVCEDGRLFAATPMDPVFVLLPIFEEARMKKENDPGKFRQVDEILYINDYPGYQHLTSIAEKSMRVVCDVKEIGSTMFFRLNDSKVLAWLYHKVKQLKLTLPTLDRNYAVRDEGDSLIDAVSLLGEYLKDEPWLKLLCGKLKLDLQKEVKAPAMDVVPSAAKTNLQPFNPEQEQEKGARGKETTKAGRHTKKAKMETQSENIKDIFRRASSRGR